MIDTDETTPERHNPAARRRSGRPRTRRRAVPAESAELGVRLERVRVVLVRPEHPFNLGQAARAMLNMGLTRLCLVDAPRAYRGSEARQGATGAAWKVLKRAEVYADIDAALEGTLHSIAFTSGRSRDLIRPPLFESELPRLVEASHAGDVALVFGCERDGLSNAEISACHAAARLSVSPEHPSLNLGQAVLLAASGVFSFRRAADEVPGPFATSGAGGGEAGDGGDAGDVGDPGRVEGDRQGLDPTGSDPGDPAPHEAITGLHEHLWRLVDQTRFPSKQNPELLAQGVRRLIARARPSVWEVQLMRGFLSHVERVLDRAGWHSEGGELESRDGGEG